MSKKKKKKTAKHNKYLQQQSRQNDNEKAMRVLEAINNDETPGTFEEKMSRHLTNEVIKEAPRLLAESFDEEVQRLEKKYKGTDGQSALDALNALDLLKSFAEILPAELLEENYRRYMDKVEFRQDGTFANRMSLVADDCLKLLDPELNKAINDIFKEHTTRPSDRIVLDNESSQKLLSMWRPPTFKREEAKCFTELFPPSDLLVSGTLPILDMEIQYTDYHYQEDGYLTDRVVIFNNYKELVAIARDQKESSVVGIVLPYGTFSKGEYQRKRSKFFGVILYNSGSDRLYMDTNVGYFGEPTESLMQALQSTETFHMLGYLTDIMEMWYGIQLTLLHPSIKEVILNGKVTRVESVESQMSSMKTKKGKKVKKVKYVKRRVIDNRVFEEAFPPNSIQRRTQVWWVLGHYREYRNGMRIWIDGYWKGPLRDLKGDYENRERLIDTDQIAS